MAMLQLRRQFTSAQNQTAQLPPDLLHALGIAADLAQVTVNAQRRVPLVPVASDMSNGLPIHRLGATTTSALGQLAVNINRD